MADIRSTIAAARPAVGTPPPIPPDDPALDRELGELALNDMGNAERFVARFGREVIYVPGRGWLVAEPGYWSQERGEQGAQLRAQRTVQLITAEAVAARPEGEDWGRERKAEHLKFARSSGNAPRIVGLLKLAEARLTRRPDELDRDPWLLAVGNGTLELGARERDGTVPVTLREWRRDDLITRQAPTLYDPEAACPQFEAFVQRILPDPSVAQFLQRYIGYGLTGDVGEQKAVLLYGSGANGKSTLLNVLRGVFGTYCDTLPVEALLEDEKGKSGSAASPELARLPGTRMVFASEPEKRRRLSTAALKAFTGGEPMLVRDMFRGFFEMVPTFKPFLSFNARPAVPADDEGMWRRINLVPFLARIPPDERVPGYERILLREASGILNWCLDGYRMWREVGLAPPEAVRAATEAYRDDSDPIGQFLDAATEPMPGASVQAAALYKAYVQWCEENALDPWSGTRFGKAIRERGIPSLKSSIVVYTGLSLLDHYAPRPPTSLWS